MNDNNFKMFRHTLNTLRYSQGFYSRLANELEEKSKEELKQIENYFNNLDVKFNDTLDVVMFLEA